VPASGQADSTTSRGGRRAARCQLGIGESPLPASSRRPGRVSSQASTSDLDSTKPSGRSGSSWSSAKVRASRVAGRQYITSASIRRAKARAVGAGWPREGCPSYSWGPANLRTRRPTRYSSGPKTPHRPTNSLSGCRGRSPRFRSHRIAAANAGGDRIESILGTARTPVAAAVITEVPRSHAGHSSTASFAGRSRGMRRSVSAKPTTSTRNTGSAAVSVSDVSMLIAVVPGRPGLPRGG
jgi:hypothetical protein